MKDREVWDAFLALLGIAAQGPCDGLIPLGVIMAPSRQSASEDTYECDSSRASILWLGAPSQVFQDEVLAAIGKAVHEGRSERVHRRRRPGE